MSIYDHDLDRNAANYVPLSPVSFLLREAHVYGRRIAVRHGDRAYSYGQFLERSRRLASALARVGVGKSDTVAIMAPNGPEMLEAHNGVPMLGAVLCPINFRLEDASVAFILRHSETKVLLTDCEFSRVVGTALAMLQQKPLVVDIDDALAAEGERLGVFDYEAFIADADPNFPVRLPDDEWQAISLNYTSGTTGNPKGVMLTHHNLLSNAIASDGAAARGPESVLLNWLPFSHIYARTVDHYLSIVAGVPFSKFAISLV